MPYLIIQRVSESQENIQLHSHNFCISNPSFKLESTMFMEFIVHSKKQTLIAIPLRGEPKH